MPAALAAAHIGHQIEHSSALMGFLVGAAVGLAVGVAVVATVASGGAALAVIAATGGAIAATGAGALAGKYIGEAITQAQYVLAEHDDLVDLVMAGTAVDLVLYVLPEESPAPTKNGGAP